MSEETKSAIMEYNGKPLLDEGMALSQLLADDVLFCNTREFICPFDKDGKNGREETIVLFVACNDVFSWGCADADPIKSGESPGDELFELYTLWLQNKRWGATKWSCLKRKEQPQDPIRDQMKAEGYWDAELEALEPNHYWTKLRSKS